MSNEIIEVQELKELPEFMRQIWVKEGAAGELLAVQELQENYPGKKIYKMMSSGGMVLFAVEAEVGQLV